VITCSYINSHHDMIPSATLPRGWTEGPPDIELWTKPISYLGLFKPTLLPKFACLIVVMKAD
jgi:hypothetical protein